jgi:hypothetical protein
MGLTVLLPLFLGIAGCGGGGSDNPPRPPSGIDATFTGQAAVANSLSLQPGGSNAEAFAVRVVVTQIDDFYDASFRVSFDPDVAEFVSMDSSGSFLLGAGVTTQFDATVSQPGALDVVARRVPPQTIGVSVEAPPAGANSISIQPGAINGNEFELVISVTGVNDLFGAAFHVEFDPQSASFVSYDSTGSLLLGAGVQTDFQVSSNSGDVTVVATRLQDNTGTIPGVNVVGTQELISLTFQATQFTSGNDFNLVAPREACDSSQPVCNDLNVNWAGGTMRNIAAPTGVDVGGSQDLVVLNFTATAETVQSPFEFADPRQICDASGFPGMCNPITPTYLGGTLDAR